MADGKIQIQSTDNRIYTVTPEVGAGGNVALTLPKEGGTLASETYVDDVVSAIPTTPSASQTVQGIIEIATDAEVQTGTDTVRAVTPAGLKNASLGLGQTWQDVSGSRVVGTTYTNSTGKPITVMINFLNSTNTTSFIVDGTTRATQAASVYRMTPFVAIIPNGSTYSISGTATSVTWNELR